MTWDPDDFYDEPNEFDQQIDGFRQTLLKAVKTNFLTKMEQLEKENDELQQVKNNFKKIERDFKAKERALEIERNDMKRQAYRERLSVLMKDFEVLMFRADYKGVLPPKCDKCNEKRKVAYVTPLGKNLEEDCHCNVSSRLYFPAEFVASEFRVNSDNKQMLIWYKMNPGRDYDHASYDSSDLAKTVFEQGMKYEDLKGYYTTFFRTQEECQKYCDWLTEKEQNKGAVNQ